MYWVLSVFFPRWLIKAWMPTKAYFLWAGYRDTCNWTQLIPSVPLCCCIHKPLSWPQCCGRVIQIPHIVILSLCEGNTCLQAPKSWAASTSSTDLVKGDVVAHCRKLNCMSSEGPFQSKSFCDSKSLWFCVKYCVLFSISYMIWKAKLGAPCEERVGRDGDQWLPVLLCM